MNDQGCRDDAGPLAPAEVGAGGRFAGRISDLERAEVPALRAEWLRLYRSAPPARLSRDLLLRGVTYRLQEAIHGGLPAAQRHQLGTLSKAGKGGPSERKPAATRLRAGTRLLRTWRGQSHSVTVLDDGFEYRGRRYRSLSLIASEVTGAHWSGPRFFGLTKPTRSVTAPWQGVPSGSLGGEPETAFDDVS